jgi:hypothetical protein
MQIKQNNMQQNNQRNFFLLQASRFMSFENTLTPGLVSVQNHSPQVSKFRFFSAISKTTWARFVWSFYLVGGVVDLHKNFSQRNNNLARR